MHAASKKQHRIARLDRFIIFSARDHQDVQTPTHQIPATLPNVGAINKRLSASDFTRLYLTDGEFISRYRARWLLEKI
jgi:hypothetical protein